MSAIWYRDVVGALLSPPAGCVQLLVAPILSGEDTRLRPGAVEVWPVFEFDTPMGGPSGCGSTISVYTTPASLAALAAAGDREADDGCHGQ